MAETEEYGADKLADMAVKAKSMGLSYGQYTTYLARGYVTGGTSDASAVYDRIKEKKRNGGNIVVKIGG